MSSILKNIKNLEDLRRRKEELRKEVEFSRQAMEFNLDHIVDRGAIRKALLTTGLTAAATYGLRFLAQKAMRRSSGEESAYAAADETGAGGAWAPFLPLLRTAADFLLDAVEDWLRRR